MAISKSCLFCLDLGVRKRGKVGKEDKRESGKEFMEYFGNKVGGIEFEDAEAANLSLFIYAPVCTPCRTTFIKIFNNFKKIQSLEKEVDGMVAELSDRVIRSHWKEQRSKVTYPGSDSEEEGEEEGDVLVQNIRWFRQKIVEFEKVKGQRTRGGGKWAPGKGKGIPKKSSTVCRKPPAVKRPSTPMQMTSKSVKKAKKQVAVSRGKVAPSANSDFEDIPMDYEQNYNYNSNNDDGDETARAVAELERLNNNDKSPTSTRESPSREKESKSSKVQTKRKRSSQLNKDDESTPKPKKKRKPEPMAKEIIVCTICNDGRIFTKLKLYKDHMRRHHGKDYRVTCPVCDKSICDRAHFLIHMFKIHEAKLNDKPLSCSICGKKFAVEYLHKRHEELHTLDATKPLKCSFCEERYPTSQEKGFLKHQHDCNIKGNFNRRSSYYCSSCDHTFKAGRSTLALEWSHNGTFHQDKLPFSCAECGDKCSKFPTENLLKMHDRIYHSAEPGPFECLLCPFKYLVVDAFLTHFQRHFFHRRCEYCESWFYNSLLWCNHNIQIPDCQTRMTEWVLEDHVRWNRDFIHYQYRVTPFRRKEVLEEEEEPPKIFTCDICTLTFGSGKLLEAHTVENHDAIFKLLECDFCGEKFMKSNQRADHIKLKHTPGFTCEICGHSVATELLLKRHVVRYHSYGKCPYRYRRDRKKYTTKPQQKAVGNASAKVKYETSARATSSASVREDASTSRTTAKDPTTLKPASKPVAKLPALTKSFPKVTASAEESVEETAGIKCLTCGIRFMAISTLANHIKKIHSVQKVDQDNLSQPSFIVPKKSVLNLPTPLLDLQKGPLNAGKSALILRKTSLNLPKPPLNSPQLPLNVRVRKSTLILRKFPLDLPKTSLDLAKPPSNSPESLVTLPKSPLKLPLKPALFVPKPSLALPKPSLTLPKPSVTLAEPSLALSKPSLILSKPSLTLPKPSLTLPKPSVTLAEPSVALSKPSLILSKSSLTLPKPSLTLPQPSLTLPKPSLTFPKPSLILPKPSLILQKPSLDLPKPGLSLPKPGLSLQKPALPPIILMVVRNPPKQNVIRTGTPPLLTLPPQVPPPSTTAPTSSIQVLKSTVRSVSTLHPPKIFKVQSKLK